MRGYDYANAGAYYITICTHERLHRFGRITHGVMHPSPLGDIVQRCWDAIPEHMPHAGVGHFVVMPNHVHGIVIIRERDPGRDVGARHAAPHTMPDGHDEPVPLAGASDQYTGARLDAPLRNTSPTDPRQPPGIPRGALGQIVASFKSAVTRAAYHDGLLARGTPVWQRNYYERIIHDAAEHDRIARYIDDNPAKWERDRFNER